MSIRLGSVTRSLLAIALALLFGERALPARAEPAAGNSAGGAAAQLLDGRTYIGHLGERGKTPGEEDTLRFEGGRFHSASCDGYGFGPAPYSSAKVGDSILFTAETTSDKEGRMVWTGTVTTHKLEGTATWTKPGQRAVEYWVKAELTH